MSGTLCFEGRADEFEQGDTVRLTGTYRNPSTQALTDPTVATCKLRLPDGSTVTYSGAQVTKDGVGLYHVDILVSQHGVYRYRWEGTGAAAGVGENAFRVKHSVFA